MPLGKNQAGAQHFKAIQVRDHAAVSSGFCLPDDWGRTLLYFSVLSGMSFQSFSMGPTCQLILP